MLSQKTLIRLAQIVLLTFVYNQCLLFTSLAVKMLAAYNQYYILCLTTFNHEKSKKDQAQLQGVLSIN